MWKKHEFLIDARLYKSIRDEDERIRSHIELPGVGTNLA